MIKYEGIEEVKDELEETEGDYEEEENAYTRGSYTNPDDDELLSKAQFKLDEEWPDEPKKEF